MSATTLPLRHRRKSLEPNDLSPTKPLYLHSPPPSLPPSSSPQWSPSPAPSHSNTFYHYPAYAHSPATSPYRPSHSHSRRTHARVRSSPDATRGGALPFLSHPPPPVFLDDEVEHEDFFVSARKGRTRAHRLPSLTTGQPSTSRLSLPPLAPALFTAQDNRHWRLPSFRDAFPDKEWNSSGRNAPLPLPQLPTPSPPPSSAGLPARSPSPQSDWPVGDYERRAQTYSPSHRAFGVVDDEDMDEITVSPDPAPARRFSTSEERGRWESPDPRLTPTAKGRTGSADDAHAAAVLLDFRRSFIAARASRSRSPPPTAVSPHTSVFPAKSVSNSLAGPANAPSRTSAALAAPRVATAPQVFPRVTSTTPLAYPQPKAAHVKREPLSTSPPLAVVCAPSPSKAHPKQIPQASSRTRPSSGSRRKSSSPVPGPIPTSSSSHARCDGPVSPTPKQNPDTHRLQNPLADSPRPSDTSSQPSPPITAAPRMHASPSSSSTSSSSIVPHTSDKLATAAPVTSHALEKEELMEDAAMDIVVSITIKQDSCVGANPVGTQAQAVLLDSETSISALSSGPGEPKPVPTAACQPPTPATCPPVDAIAETRPSPLPTSPEATHSTPKAVTTPPPVKESQLRVESGDNESLENMMEAEDTEVDDMIIDALGESIQVVVEKPSFSPASEDPLVPALLDAVGATDHLPSKAEWKASHQPPASSLLTLSPIRRRSTNDDGALFSSPLSSPASSRHSTPACEPVDSAASQHSSKRNDLKASDRSPSSPISPSGPPESATKSARLTSFSPEPPRKRKHGSDTPMRKRRRSSASTRDAENDTLPVVNSKAKPRRPAVLSPASSTSSEASTASGMSRSSVALSEHTEQRKGTPCSSPPTSPDVAIASSPVLSAPHLKQSEAQQPTVPEDDTELEAASPVISGDNVAVKREESVPATTPAPEQERETDKELIGLIIETMATSRASALAPSTLYSALQRARPQLAATQNKRVWLRDISRVLESHAKRGLFGCVGPAADTAAAPTGRKKKKTVETAVGGRHVERMWFYIPDGDEDRERAEVAQAMMPQRRSESRKFKRYYWKPLDKISRWDGEDEL